VTLPDATGVTTPTPLLILTDVAFVVVHDKVADEPLVMLVGLTASVTVGVELGGGFVVEPPPPPLPQPARAAMTILIATTLEVFMTIDLLSCYTIFLLGAHDCSKLTISKLCLSPFQSCDLFRGFLKLYTRPLDLRKGIEGASKGGCGWPSPWNRQVKHEDESGRLI
jgi:hypothetical protein